MPRSRKSRPSSPLTRAKNRIRGASNKAVAVAFARDKLEQGLVDKVAAWASRWLAPLGVLGPVIARGYHDLRAEPVLPAVALDRELIWIRGTFLEHKHVLQNHVLLRDELHGKLLEKSDTQILDALDKLERNSGYSLYSVALRIGLLQFCRGLEAQKEFAAALRDRASPMVRFYAFWWSVRAEENSSIDHFASEIGRRVKAWEVSSEIRAQIEFQLLGKLPVEGSEQELLSTSLGSSLVDTYEAFVALAAHCVAERRGSAQLFANAVREISKEIADSRLEKIAVIAGLSDGMDAFVSGSVDFQNANLAALADEPQGKIESLDELSGAAQLGIVPTLPNAVMRRIHILLREVHASGEAGARAANELSKVGIIFQQQDVGLWCAAVARSFSPQAAPFNLETDTLRFIGSSGPNLSGLNALPEQQARLYLQHLEKKLGPCAFVEAAAILANGPLVESPVSLSPMASAEISLRRAVRRGTAYDTLSVCEASLAIGPTRAAVHFQIKSLLTVGKAGEALRLATAYLHDDPSRYTWMPLDTLIGDVYVNEINLFPAQIETPILFFYYTKYVDPSKISYRAYTAEDFLLSRGADRPSLIKSRPHGVTNAYWVTLLADVCGTSTLRLFSAFETELELETERIAICQQLTVLDPQKKEGYEDEARSVVRSRVIKEALKQLQASKISIDEDALIDWAKRNLREDFDRYKSLVASGLVVVDDAYREALRIALETGNFSRSLYDVPVNEASSLFTWIVTRFLQQCGFDPEHGLDCYLSLRVRHGTLSGLLRSAAERERIVTKRTSDSGEYRPNIYWKDATLPDLGMQKWADVEKRLSQFSHDLDALIREVTSEYIQVSREDKPKGLFTVSINPIAVYSLASEMELETSFDDFISRCLQIFWVIIGTKLSDARDTIRAEVRARFRKLFDDLQNDLRFETELAPLADAALRARNETDISIDQLASWFELPTPTETLTFSIAELTEVALEAVRNFHRDFQPDIKPPQLEMPLQNALLMFSDIFFILFENVYAHCGVSTPWINIESKLIGAQLETRVENTVADDRCGVDQLQRVRDSFHRIESGEYLSDVGREGGTGAPETSKANQLQGGEILSQLRTGRRQEDILGQILCAYRSIFLCDRAAQ